jgi:hypothetical protein
MSKHAPDTDTCSRPDCGEPTPWDMLAVVVDGTWFCSPPCAATHVDTLEAPPETVRLHDPQHHVDRDAFPDVDSDAVAIRRRVHGMDDAVAAIGAVSGMIHAPFRDSRGATAEIDVGE